MRRWQLDINSYVDIVFWSCQDSRNLCRKCSSRERTWSLGGGDTRWSLWNFVMNASQFQCWLQRQGCSFEQHKGGSGHLTVRLGNKTPQLPMHGSRKQLGRKLVAKIKKDLGLT